MEIWLLEWELEMGHILLTGHNLSTQLVAAYLLVTPGNWSHLRTGCSQAAGHSPVTDTHLLFTSCNLVPTWLLNVWQWVTT